MLKLLKSFEIFLLFSNAENIFEKLNVDTAFVTTKNLTMNWDVKNVSNLHKRTVSFI